MSGEFDETQKTTNCACVGRTKTKRKINRKFPDQEERAIQTLPYTYFLSTVATKLRRRNIGSKKISTAILPSNMFGTRSYYHKLKEKENDRELPPTRRPANCMSSARKIHRITCLSHRADATEPLAYGQLLCNWLCYYSDGSPLGASRETRKETRRVVLLGA